MTPSLRALGERSTLLIMLHRSRPRQSSSPGRKPTVLDSQSSWRYFFGGQPARDLLSVCSDVVSQIRQSQGGDRAAFDSLALRFEGEIRDLVARLLGSDLRARVDVEDLCQETFLRAFRTIVQFRGDSEAIFRGWLRTIARHVVEECGRRMRAARANVDRERSLTRSSEGPGDGDPEASTPSPSRLLRREECYERLMRALETLSDAHRRVIVLSRLEGLSMKEVAERMNRSPKAASVLLVRAMLKLRESFGNTESLGLPTRNLGRDLRTEADADPGRDGGAPEDGDDR